MNRSILDNDGKNPIKLLLFLTYGVSIAQWQRQGILSRELACYKKMEEYGIVTSIVSFGDKKDTEILPNDKGINVIPRYEKHNRYNNRILRTLNSFWIPDTVGNAIKAAHVLKSNQLWGNWLLVKAKQKFKKRWVARIGFEKVRNDEIAGKPWYWIQFIRWLSFMSYRAADHVIVPTVSIADYLNKNYNVDMKKITTIGTPVNTDLFSPGVNEMKNGRGIYIGRLSEEKNIHLLIQASKISGFGVDIIGDGPLRNVIEQQINEYRADVKLLGTIPNEKLGEIVRKYEFCILCSKYEGSPKVIIEAMACGLPIIGTDVPGISDMIANGVTGILCSTSAECLAKAMSSLIRNPEQLAEMGVMARKHILEKHSLETAARIEAEIIMSLQTKSIC
jgi:glycosyltransferase involved in cell wall biosynthesis